MFSAVFLLIPEILLISSIEASLIAATEPK
jgi:hypothetical protein